MNTKWVWRLGVAALATTLCLLGYSQLTRRAAVGAADNPNPPASPVKLIFIHHSTGGNWLADSAEHEQAGGLGLALRNNNYFVSATNYGWGPGSIGSSTDILNWPQWFTDTVMTAVYAETGQNICGEGMCFGNWTRMADPNPTAKNEIVLFKSCFPNSDIYGNPNDPPLATPNDYDHTVANYKAVYNSLLPYFAAHQDKLFVVITAPPLSEVSYVINDNTTSAAARAANARAFNTWLVNTWLASYAHNNVAVFDFYNVLTSNGSAGRIDDTSTREEPHDYALRPNGNHHYWNGSAIVHPQTINNNFAAYPYFSMPPASQDPWSDDHPTAAGNQKATAEFVPLLNVFYHRWKGGGTPCTALTEAGITGPTSGYTGTQYAFTAAITPANASTPITYTWSPAPASGQGSATARYTWATLGVKTVTLTAQNCGGSDTATHDITLNARPVADHFVYLPLVLRNYAPTPPTCATPLTSATISGPTSGYMNTAYTFTAAPTPDNATTHIVYTWSPAPQSGQGTTSATYQWAATGSKPISVAASNCAGAHTANDNHTITIQGAPSGDLIQPDDLVYLGAFRLPDDAAAPRTFEYGGNAMTFNPDGHITNTDAFSGSLFITGHERTDEHLDGNQVAEVSIPVPVNSRNVDDLPTAEFLQDFHDVTAGHFTELSTVPKVGLQYLNHADTGALLHITWGRHLQQLEDFLPSQGWVSVNLAAPNFQGEWFIGDQNPNSVNGYLLEIPAAWADAHAAGRMLGTGRFSPGGIGGMGPTLLAYRPWAAGGAAPISGAHLSETPLLLYARAVDTAEITRCLTLYQHADSWEGGAWLTTLSGNSAMLFAGTKATGIKYWYGYIHPTTPLSPCVDLDEHSFTTCRLADGSECPEADYAHCCTEGGVGADACVSARGWWSTRHDAQLIFYDPADLAQVAAGTLESWEPQPYAMLDIDDRLYLNPPEWDRFELGWGDQRRNRIGDVAYDRVNGYLYVIELSGDGAKPMVHVWQVQ